MTQLEEIVKYLKAVIPERVALIAYNDWEVGFIKVDLYHLEFHEKDKEVWHFTIAKDHFEDVPIRYIVLEIMETWLWKVWNEFT